ncbi:MAG TPA: hypothetical protein VFW33_01375 [Gemmataceae bacterium]|nr:hypothetical protein [Gemmataceae bacterium]
MAPRTRLIPAVPTRIVPPAALPRRPRGVILAGVLTLIALAPLGAVLGFVVALKFGQDAVLFALLGGLLGALFAAWKTKN